MTTITLHTNEYVQRYDISAEIVNELSKIRELRMTKLIVVNGQFSVRRELAYIVNAIDIAYPENFINADIKLIEEKKISQELVSFLKERVKDHESLMIDCS